MAVRFLTTMIHMGQNMGWDVIAEGLENPGITEAAAILGIPYGQGYDIARPLPAREIPAWMTNHAPGEPPGPIRTFPGAWPTTGSSPGPEPRTRARSTPAPSPISSTPPAPRQPKTGTGNNTPPAKTIYPPPPTSCTGSPTTPPPAPPPESNPARPSREKPMETTLKRHSSNQPPHPAPEGGRPSVTARTRPEPGADR